MNTFIADSSVFKKFQDTDSESLQKLANIHRINCLAGLKSSGHGWPGACFSSMEILTCIYHKYIKDPTLPSNNRPVLYMSKGHAAMAQYAILAALGALSFESLRTYDRAGGLPAHCDRNVPGVDSDSGSLGQGLSKAIGTAMSNELSKGNKFPVFTVIGDGEMQEGQVFEAFLTLAKHNPGRVIPILDRNYLQSDSTTADIKDAADWAAVFRGIGLKVYEIDGHNCKEICSAIDSIIYSSEPSVIIAKTIKGGGSQITSMSDKTPRRMGVWHGKIPSDEEYFAIIKELTEKVNCPTLTDAYLGYISVNKPDPQTKPAAASKALSTGEAFAKALMNYANDENVFVLDADLEKPCRLAPVAPLFGRRFKEIGISEQDMTSVACGIALTGKIAVINTYGSFYKRAYDQLFAAVTEKLPIIAAAHYSGADFFTDGKSHQSVMDISMIRSLGDIDILEPADEESAAWALDYSINRMKKEFADHGQCKPTYIRLHRTPCDLHCCKGLNTETDENADMLIKSSAPGESRGIIFTSGPHMTFNALEAQKVLSAENIPLDVMPIIHYMTPKLNTAVKAVLKSHKYIFTFEDNRRENGLGAYIASFGIKMPVIAGVREYVQSVNSMEEMFRIHRLTSDDVCQLVKKVLNCKDHNN